MPRLERVGRELASSHGREFADEIGLTSIELGGFCRNQGSGAADLAKAGFGIRDGGLVNTLDPEKSVTCHATVSGPCVCCLAEMRQTRLM